MEWQLEPLGDHYKDISRMFHKDLFNEAREYCLKNLLGNEYEIITSLVEWVWSHQSELDEYIEGEQRRWENTKEQSKCAHTYGHSSALDMLIDSEEDEQKCLDNGQLFDRTYPYTMFNYCPDFGKKLERKENDENKNDNREVTKGC